MKFRFYDLSALAGLAAFDLQDSWQGIWTHNVTRKAAVEPANVGTKHFTHSPGRCRVHRRPAHMDTNGMILNAQQIAPRDKLILSGLYLSKYDVVGLKKLGFESFTEAFNVLGYAMGSRPATIKNYRDEFDPLYPNRRRGRHKRSVRDYCLKLFEQYHSIDLESFSDLIRSFVGHDAVQATQGPDESDHFAKRLITGLAAERYFETVQPTIPVFKGYLVQNTTRLGCGYDFRLLRETTEDFLAVEVKGLKERVGSLSMTPKEHDAAKALTDQFFLVVVKNFRESPYHQIFQNPLSKLEFRKTERVMIHVSWLTSV